MSLLHVFFSYLVPVSVTKLLFAFPHAQNAARAAGGHVSVMDSLFTVPPVRFSRSQRENSERRMKTGSFLLRRAHSRESGASISGPIQYLSCSSVGGERVFCAAEQTRNGPRKRAAPRECRPFRALHPPLPLLLPLFLIYTPKHALSSYSIPLAARRENKKAPRRPASR